jgi:hypothetical protein
MCTKRNKVKPCMVHAKEAMKGRDVMLQGEMATTQPITKLMAVVQQNTMQQEGGRAKP